MNILEDQVSDLNCLVESPIAPITPAPASMNDRPQSENADGESPRDDNGNGNGKKRKGDDISSTNGHTRAKRNRYISIAWYIQFQRSSSTNSVLVFRILKSYMDSINYLSQLKQMLTLVLQQRVQKAED